MGEPALEIKNLDYIDNGDWLFNKLSFSLDIGEGALVLAHPQYRGRHLLKICATLERPDEGKISWFGRNYDYRNEAHILDLRRNIAWVHRESRLVSNMTLLDNAILGMIYHRNISRDLAHERVKDLFDKFRLSEYRNYRPATLGYSRQRVAAYLRELAKRPRLILLETPYLDLDQNFELVMNEIKEMALRKESAFIMSGVSAKELSGWVDKVIVLNDSGSMVLDAKDFDAAGHFED